MNEALGLSRGLTPSDSVILERLKALMSQHPSFNIRSAITTVEYEMYEFIVICVRSDRFAVLDWIFDNKIITPDHVAMNGSPLVLFAMQRSTEMFTYFVSRGAQLIRDGDLVHNRKLGLTAFSCAGSRDDISRVLLNLILAHRGMSKITNITTLRMCKQVAERNHYNEGICAYIAEYINKKEQYDKVTQMKLLRDKASADIMSVCSDKKTPRDILFGLVADGCRTIKDFETAGSGLSDSDIRHAMCLALSLPEKTTYEYLRSAFPTIRIA